MRKLFLVVVGMVLAWNLLTAMRTWQARRAMVRLQPKPMLPPRPSLAPRPVRPRLVPRAPLESAGTPTSSPSFDP